MKIEEMKYDEFIVAYRIAHSEGWIIGKNDHKTIVDKSGFFALKIEGDIVALLPVSNMAFLTLMSDCT